MPTGRELITRALMEIGYTASGDVPSAAEQADAHVIAKRMVNSLGADRLAIYDLLRTATTLTSGTRDYTIGPGGAINIARPLWLEEAGCILDATATDPIEIGIDVYTDQRWAALRLKTFDGSPLSGVYFDRNFDSNGRATLSTYPTINTGNVQLVTYTPRPATGFDALATTYLFPPGYDDAWHYELSYRLQRPFGRPLDPDLNAQRIEAWARVKRSNFRPAELRCEAMPGGRPGGVSRSDFDSGALS